MAYYICKPFHARQYPFTAAALYLNGHYFFPPAYDKIYLMSTLTPVRDLKALRYGAINEMGANGGFYQPPPELPVNLSLFKGHLCLRCHQCSIHDMGLGLEPLLRINCVEYLFNPVSNS